ncbi:hypothetical protein RvY_03302 [Ramazzottius varieornatus]|uniref:Mediator of RNA polymerase II transcription subunit 27 n=1 Tax=Ramazzottius varieornatus TaxID=947166 RepID=A0A1D1URB7_RAMVA|nr:hypothetical protein RvY_03302 [Ramazzottius varieornatus]
MPSCACRSLSIAALLPGLVGLSRGCGILMADTKRAELFQMEQMIQQVEAALNRQNIALKDYHTVIHNARDENYTAEEAAVEIQTALNNLESCLIEVDQKVADLPSSVSSLGLASFLSSCPPIGATTTGQGDGGTNAAASPYRSLYEELITTYSIHERGREYCSVILPHLSVHAHRKMGKPPKFHPNLPRPHEIYEDVSKKIDAIFRQQSASLSTLTFAVYDLPAAGVIVELVVDRIFRVALTIRGTAFVEGVNIRGSDENFNLEAKALRPIDLWTPSGYEVYRVLARNATEAVLHYHSPNEPERSLRGFLQWINSLATLFSSPCKRCGKYLDSGLPATWRDYKKLEAYHEACRVLTFTTT